MIANGTAVEQIINDHRPALIRLADAAWRKYGIHRFGVSFKTGYQRGQKDTIGWMYATLTGGFDNLTGPEMIRELRKGDESIYWPVLMEDDGQLRKVWLLCEHCDSRSLFTADGICPNCGREMGAT